MSYYKPNPGEVAKEPFPHLAGSIDISIRAVEPNLPYQYGATIVSFAPSKLATAIPGAPDEKKARQMIAERLRSAAKAIVAGGSLREAFSALDSAHVSFNPAIMAREDRKAVDHV